MAKKPAKATSQAGFSPTRIREWRDHRGYTLEQLGEIIGMAPSNISMLERGDRGYTQKALEKLSLALGTDPSSLISRSPTDKDEIWQIWERAAPGEREAIVEIATTITKRRPR